MARRRSASAPRCSKTMPDFRRDHLRFRRRAPRKRVRGQPSARRSCSPSWGTRHSVEDALTTLHGTQRQRFHRRDRRAGSGRELPPEFHERTEGREPPRASRGIEAVVGAVDFVRSLPADTTEGGGFVELDPLDTDPSRASRLSGGIRRSYLQRPGACRTRQAGSPTSISMPRGRSGSPIERLRDHRGFARSARQARSRRALG